MKKVVIQTYVTEDYCEFQRILVDGEQVWESSDLAMDCPEDATLSRSMTNAFQIMDVCKKVGSEFELESETVENLW